MTTGALCSCAIDLGSPAKPEERTFGEIVYRESCSRVLYTEELQARERDRSRPLDVSGAGYRAFCDGRGPEAVRPPPPGAPAVAAALDAQRRRLVSAVDLVAPEPLLKPLDAMLRAVLPLQDDGTLRAAVTGASRALAAAAADPAAAAALANLGWREGGRHREHDGALARALLADDGFDQVQRSLLPLLAESTAGAGDAAARPSWLALLQAGRLELAHSTALSAAERADPARTLRLALRFLLSTNSELRTLPADRLPAVLRDPRGLPQLLTLRAPYVDQDGDKLADADASGRFLGADRQPLPQVAPFPSPDPAATDRAAGRDAQGRALAQAGRPELLYSYVNLDETVLAALVRDAPGLFAPERDIPLGLLAGAGHLMGARAPSERRYGDEVLRYSGFDPQGAPLLELLYGYLQLLGYADLPRALSGVQALLRGSEGSVARNLGAVLRAFDEGKKPEYAAAALKEEDTLYDDLLPVLIRLLKVPDLLPAVLEATTDPASADLADLLGQLASDRSLLYMSQQELDSEKPGAVTGQVGLRIDRSRPDSDVDKNAQNAANNRSILQRVMHLVHDANGLVFCNKKGAKVGLSTYDACEFMQIDDLAVFYLYSIIGHDIRDNPGRYPAETRQGANFFNALRSSGWKILVGALDNAAGDALLEGTLLGTGIPGFTRYPTPPAAARLLFMDPNNPKRASLLNDTTDSGACEPRRPGTLCCNQNHGWVQHHDGVLFALERYHPKDKPAVTMFDALRPLVSAFARFTECASYNAQGVCQRQRSAVKILADLFAVLHRHWPTEQSSAYGAPYETRNQKSGLSRYEPLVARLLQPDMDVWESSRELSRALLATNADGTPMKVVVERLLLWLLDPREARLGGPLLDYAGGAQALRGDGQPLLRVSDDPIIVDILPKSLAGVVTPYSLLADAYRHKRQRLAMDPAMEQRWKQGVSALADLFLTARSTAGGYRFNNPRVKSVTLAALDLLRERLSAHGQAGDLATWVRGDPKAPQKEVAGSLLSDVRGSLRGPLFAAAVDLAAQLSAKEDGRRALYGLFGRVAVDARGGPALLALLADGLQLALDDGNIVPLLRAAAPALAVPEGAADAALQLLRRSRPLDEAQVMRALSRNLFQESPAGLLPVSHLGDAVAEINREGAGDAQRLGAPLTADDYALLLRTAAHFLGDQQRGLTRFLEIVASRRPAP